MGTAIWIALAVALVALVAYGAWRQRRTKSEHSAYYGRNIDVTNYEYGKDHRSGP